MALKPSSRRKIFYFTTALIAIIAIAIIIVPPMFTLNQLKPKLESAFTAQTGVDTSIRGDVHFSLIGAATIVARDVHVPDGRIGAVAFRIPISSLFNLENAHLSNRISVYDADIKISQLTPVSPEYDIDLHNVNVNFLGKDYKIINGSVGNGEFKATIRTDQHKYELSLNDDAFYITNKNNNLVILGNLTPNGGARGTMSLKTDNINRMFQFSEPQIPGLIDIEMKFDWDGGYGVQFSDIHANNFTGNIGIYPNGRRMIQLTSSDTSFDFSFLLNPTKIIYETSFDLNLRGHLKLGSQEFSHLIIQATGNPGELHIERIVADNTVISGGTISATGANDINISTILDGHLATCVFSGTPEQWSCKRFVYRNITGTLSVNQDEFVATISSDDPMPSDDNIRNMLKILGRRGSVKFMFSDAAGTLYVDDTTLRPEFKFARDKTLGWLRDDIDFIPEFMRNEIGDFALSGDRVTFRPHSGRWELTTEGDAFVISGKNVHDWFPDLDLRAISNSDYFISGLRNGKNISNLTIRIWGHEFIGSATDKNITLKTDALIIDSFIDQKFIDNYDEMEFLTNAPIMLPFGLDVNISLHADKLIYNGDEYQNFLYSLKQDTQTYSITDNDRGNLLAIISRNKKDYDISIQASNFQLNGQLLSSNMPINISNSRITGEVDMHTSGQIAHDITYNMTGNIDATFSGGTITGFGVDEFYASAENITSFNAEYAIGAALDGGNSALKEMHISGNFSGDNFATDEPLTISMRHATATGALEISDGQMRANLDIILRGTSPDPSKIAIEILPSGVHRYSLSEIMTNFDSSFLRKFVETHKKF